MAKSKARYLADILQSDGSSTFVGDFSVPASFTIDPEGSPGGTVTIAGDIVSTGPTGLDNASLQNDSITINSYVTDLGTSLTLDTDDIQESSPATNIWFTQARARESISLTDNGGDGSLSYNNTTGEFSFTGPSAAEVRAHFSSGTGVTLSSGQISIGQSVATSDSVTFVGVTGTGSSSFDTLSVTNTATIPYDNSISGLTATTVQSAISEINNLLGGGNVGSQASFDSYEFTATTNQTTFDLANLGLSPTPSYIAGYIQVFLNGVLLAEADYTATDGQTIVLSSGAEAGDILTVTVLDSFDIANLLRVTSIDASASTNSITLDANDDLSLTGSLSFADNEKAIFGADSDLQIFHVGGSASYVETATNDLYLKGFRDVYLQTSGANSVIAVGGGATTLLHNGSAKLATTSTGIDVTGTVTADGLTIAGDSILDSEANFSPATTTTADKSLVVASSGATAGAGQLGASIAFSRINTQSPRAAIAAFDATTNYDQMGLKFYTHGSSTGSDPMNLRFQIDHDGNTRVIDDSLNTHILLGASGAATFNDQGNDSDFRVESNNNTHMLFVDAGNDRVHIASPGTGPSNFNVITNMAITNTGGVQYLLMGNQDSAGVNNPSMIVAANGALEFGNGNSWSDGSGGTFSQRFKIVSGEITVNENSYDQDFRVESDASTHALFVDAGSEAVGVFTSSPNAPLHVQTSHTSSDVTAANSNATLNIANSGAGNGVYNAIKFAANQQDMYIMAFNNNTQANRRLGFFVGSVAGDAIEDERFIIKGDGDVAVINESAAPINSASNPGKFRIQGHGWNTSLGSRDQGWSLQSTGTYSNRKFGQTYPDLLFNATTSDSVYSDTAVAKFYYDGAGYKWQVDAGAVFNESSLDSDFRVESNNNANMLFVDGGQDRIGMGTSNPGSTLHVAGTSGSVHTFLGYFGRETTNSTTDILTVSDQAFNSGTAIYARLVATSATANESAVIEFWASLSRVSGGANTATAVTPVVAKAIAGTAISAGTLAWSGTTLQYTSSVTTNYVGYSMELHVTNRDGATITVLP